MAAKSDWLVFGVDVLNGAQTVKATSWQDAAGQYVAANSVISGQIVCVPAASVQRANVQSQPQLSITAA